MEVQFRFYNYTLVNPNQGYQEIPSLLFDTRGGLDNLMVGLNWLEVDTDYRLLHQMEKALNMDLALLDYWSDKVYDQYLNVTDYILFLKQFIRRIYEESNYYTQIDYPHVSKVFLEKGVLTEIQALVQHFNSYQEKGAISFRIETI